MEGGEEGRKIHTIQVQMRRKTGETYNGHNKQNPNHSKPNIRPMGHSRPACQPSRWERLERGCKSERQVSRQTQSSSMLNDLRS